MGNNNIKAQSIDVGSSLSVEDYASSPTPSDTSSKIMSDSSSKVGNNSNSIASIRGDSSHTSNSTPETGSSSSSSIEDSEDFFSVFSFDPEELILSAQAYPVEALQFADKEGSFANIENGQTVKVIYREVSSFSFFV